MIIALSSKKNLLLTTQTHKNLFKYLRDALVGFVKQYLGHALDRYTERYDCVFTRAAGRRVAAVCAQRAEDCVARLAEQQLLERATR